MSGSLPHPPILLFGRAMQNNAAMRWTLPFRSRVNGDRNGEDNRYSAGDACPDFLCVGAQKGGTSWLYRQLERHPDFWMPPVKEFHYLNSLTRTRRFHPPRCRDQRDDNQDARRDKLRFTDKVRSGVARFFEQELKACAAELSGPAKQWPARYGFSVLIFLGS
jgi:hypothetical protein